MKVRILGHVWTVHVHSDKEFNEDAENAELGAYILPVEKEIHFPRSSLVEHIVRHEITHAFYVYTCVTEFGMSQENMEEFVCEFMALHADAILDVSRKIIRRHT